MKSLEEAIVLGTDPISSKIHSKDRKSVYTTGDISRRTIVNTAKQYWSEHKYEDPIIPTVIVWLRKGQDDRLLFGDYGRLRDTGILRIRSLNILIYEFFELLYHF